MLNTWNFRLLAWVQLAHTSKELLQIIVFINPWIVVLNSNLHVFKWIQNLLIWLLDWFIRSSSCTTTRVPLQVFWLWLLDGLIRSEILINSGECAIWVVWTKLFNCLLVGLCYLRSTLKVKRLQNQISSVLPRWLSSLFHQPLWPKHWIFSRSVWSSWSGPWSL
jgi:hypothetical protein